MDAYQATTEQRRQTDVRHLRMLGVIPDGAKHYQLTRNGWVIPVGLEWTAPHYGGMRPWFVCRCCARRVAILYWANDTPACRQCHKLTYASRRERPEGRAFRKAGRIRHKLGWIAGIAFGRGDKPLGMHWQTFARLCAEHDRAARQAMGGIADRLRAKMARLEQLSR